MNIIPEAVSEAVLDKVFQLQKRRERRIEEEGKFFSVGTTSLRIKAIQEDNEFHFMPSAPILVGHFIRHTGVFGCYIVTEVHEEAGRLRAVTEYLSSYTSVSTKQVRATDPLGRDHYKVVPTNWTNVPIAVSGNRARLPKAYAPDRGGLLLIDGAYHEVKELRFYGPVVECTIEEF